MKKADQVKKFINDKKVVTVDDICKHFNIKEPMARRYLQQLRAFSSVNSGAAYYILPDNHTFADSGILNINGKVFYKGGNLVDAAVHLIEQSPAGMSVSELLEILKTSVHSQLPKLVIAGKLNRAKVSGVGTYIYLSADSKSSKQQLKRRRKLVADSNQNILAEEEFDPEAALHILVTMIKKPNLTAKGVALSLQRRGRKISSCKVEQIVQHFGITKKNF
jgi:predicted transcriptional regulator